MLLNCLNTDIKDHINEEIAFLGSFPAGDVREELIRSNEDILEHIDEMFWLVDNTTKQKLPDFAGYFERKFMELYRAVISHCQQTDTMLKLAGENLG